MKKNTLIVGLLALVIGFFVGQYGTNEKEVIVQKTENEPSMQQEMNHEMMGMDSMMMDMTARMKGKVGDELDKIFLEDMIVHHQGAVDMAIILAGGTQRPELKKMASDIITVQEAEIDMMEKWLTEWFRQEN